jgi:hypothetical protein
MLTPGRTTLLLLALSPLLIGGPASGAGVTSAKEPPMPARVVIENVDRYRVYEPLFECVRVVLSQRGEKYTPAYVQGISGAAFRIGGPCPCAPTCESAMGTDDLIKTLGYECERGPLFSEGKQPAELYPAVLARMKEEIRAGRPVIVWNAFTTAEFDVVCGFDEGKHELIGRGSYKGLDGYASAAEARPTEHEVAPAIGAIFVGKKVKGFDARAAEMAALKEAVAHARGMSATLECLPTGLACYDYWIASYENKGKLVRAKSRDGKTGLDYVASQPGDDFYPLIVYPSTHAAAAEFLREIAPKYPEAKAHLAMAAEHFAREAAALESVGKDLGDRKQGPTDEQCVRAAGHLREAKAMYELGIGEIERAVRKMGAARAG